MLLQRRIEEVSLNSWPALQQILFDGWILRFSEGYTKRANSVNPLFASSMDVDEKINTCERLYAERGLPTVFRLTPFSSPAGLDGVLEGRNYQKVAPTSVLRLDLNDRIVRPSPAAELRHERLDDWLDVFCRFGESSVDKHQTHKRILQAIPGKRFLASLVDSGQVVACGLGVLENGYLGLFDLITDPQRRNEGYGTQLVSSLLGLAQEEGCLHAYLQVVNRNAPARRLYAKLGFQEVYPYWYRVLTPDV
ncbi:MAG: GNAT family N-acetyltransferase [Chloroflexota bacterium]|nr:GNAT family N-acetyltransferase [Chloroflexota bacterium]